MHQKYEVVMSAIQSKHIKNNFSVKNVCYLLTFKTQVLTILSQVIKCSICKYSNSTYQDSIMYSCVGIFNMVPGQVLHRFCREAYADNCLLSIHHIRQCI